MSLPLVVIVFKHQESKAEATITWSNAFAENESNPFSVVNKVSWSNLSKVLNSKFESQVGAPLTYEDLSYLCEYQKLDIYLSQTFKIRI